MDAYRTITYSEIDRRDSLRGKLRWLLEQRGALAQDALRAIRECLVAVLFVLAMVSPLMLVVLSFD